MTEIKEYGSWDKVFSNPKSIRVETFNTGYIKGIKKGMFNLKSKAYKDKYNFKTAKLPVLSHLIYYNNKNYLIDTGFDSSFSKRWGGNFKGILRPLYFYNRYFQSRNSLGIDRQIESKEIELNSIYLTHAHEHCIGLSGFNNNIPVILGKGEKDINFFPFVYSSQIESRKNIKHLDFNKEGIDMPLLGRCIDLFGDGSFWAIDTHGHTKGHVSYLINGIERTVLIVGDAIICSLGFEDNIESGTYNENIIDSKKSFDKLKNFLSIYNNIEVIFGHEVKGMYDINYIKK